MALWNGRFKGRLDPRALAFSTSLGVDRLLYDEDIEGSLAHVGMLARKGIIPRRDAARIARALKSIRREIAAGKIAAGGGGRFVAEDIHMAIEQRLMEKIGPAGGRLHTARSRNDQVALDERLYLRKAGKAVTDGIKAVQRALLAQASRHRKTIVPGYTHLQQAQPILFAHHLLAYCEMLDRDAGRFADCLARAGQSPLGAAALAGTSFPIDRRAAARALGLRGIVGNSIDAVSDRDALLEFMSACAVAMMHLSRLAEELVLWSSMEWGFAEIGDAFTTGSSIMPQKKNPDMAELVRGKTGRVYGDLIALLTVMKGLPLAYNRDLQEDKEPLFDAAATLTSSLEITALMLRSTKFNAKRFENDWRADHLLATELADYLVRAGMPFRKAHAVVGKIVRTSAGLRMPLRGLSLEAYRRFSPLFKNDLYKVIDPRASVGRKRSAGSTSPAEVRRALASWTKRLR